MRRKKRKLQSATGIINQLKHMFKLNTDLEVANLLGVSPTTLSTWKYRNSIDYKMIIAFADEHLIDLNKLFLNKEIHVRLANDPFENLIDVISEAVEQRISSRLEEIKATNVLVFDLLFENEEVRRRIEEVKSITRVNYDDTKGQLH